MSFDKTGGKGTRKGSPCANYSRLRAEEGEVGSEGRLLSFLCLSCDVIHNGICSNGFLQSCYKPATNAALFEICCKLIWSKCCYKREFAILRFVTWEESKKNVLSTCTCTVCT